MKVFLIISKKYGTKEVFVDDNDFEIASRFNWYLNKVPNSNKFYAVKEHTRGDSGKRRKITLHKFVMGKLNDGYEIDHVDNNGLNCQRNNLRVCTHKNNCRNRSKAKNSASKYLGVFIKRNRRKSGVINISWVAALKESGKSRCTETKSFKFSEEGEIEAAKFYDMMAKKHYGEFANLNFKECQQ